MRRELFNYLLLGVINVIIIFGLPAESSSETPTAIHFKSFDLLEVTPSESTEFSGHPGGPFMPTNIFYQLTNNGETPFSWVLTKPAWLDTDFHEGVLNPGEYFTLKCRANSSANLLTEGRHSGILRFTVLDFGDEVTREINLNIYTEPKIWYEPFSFNIVLPYGSSESRYLTVGNSGDDVLNFALLGEQTNFYPAPVKFIETQQNATDQSIPQDTVDFLAAELDYSSLEEGTYIPGEIIVCFAAGDDDESLNTDDQNALLTELGGGYVAHELNIIPGLCLVKLPAEMSVAEALAEYNRCEGVLRAEPNIKFQLDNTYPSDTRFTELWGLHNTGQLFGTIDADIDMPEAWDFATGSREIIVAVIDSGADYTHPDLAGNMWINPLEMNGAAGIDDDGNGFTDDIHGYDFIHYIGDPSDEVGHGTHVAGTIGAVGNNGIGVTGVCWDVQIMALKFIDNSHNGNAFSGMAAIEYAIAMGARIINLSWGGQNEIGTLFEAAIVRAGNAGLLMVTSAGNNNNDNDVNPHYPASYDYDNIISVMASDFNDVRSDWYINGSNWGGATVDLSAPGSSILSCEPGGGYGTRDGTSMAAPHVSGAAALIWSTNPELNYQGIKDILLQKVDPIPALNGLNATGGRLNVYNALLATRAGWIDYIPQSGSIDTDQWRQSEIIFQADRIPGVYEGLIHLYSNDPFSTSIRIPATLTVKIIDYYTEHFSSEDNDLSFESLTLTPGDTFNYYHACRQYTPEFFIDPAGGADLVLQDDDYIPIILPPGEIFNFYGVDYDTFYIGSNGFISFTTGDFRYIENPRNHFMFPRIAGLFDDLDPTSGGRISWQTLDDRIVVTFEDVPEFHVSAGNSFQIELFYSGVIRITWLNIAAHDGLVGLSKGEGIPEYFVENDFTVFCNCLDLNCDRAVNLLDYSIFAAYWLNSGCPQKDFWCEGSDIDRDGDVDLIDFHYLSVHWLDRHRN